MAMQRVDNDFKVHTSYHKDFFLLRTKVLVNGENTEITSVKEGSDEGPVMSFCHDGSTTITLSSIANIISSILHKRSGIHHVDAFYCKQSPLFHVTFSSELCLKKFLEEIDEVQCTMEQELVSMISGNLKNSSIHGIESVTVEVQPELFLVSPDLPSTKGAELHPVTTGNCSFYVTQWKNSKLFDFESLFQDEPSRSSESNGQIYFPAVNDNMTELMAAEGVMTTTKQKIVEGVPPHKVPDDEPLGYSQQEEVKEKIAGLVYGEELLRDLDAVQSHANQEVSEVMAMLDELHKNVQKLAPEKRILEAKPKIEEEEGCPLTCKQEESEFKSLQIEPCDADICQLEQNLQEDELDRVATVEEKKAMETIKEQHYAQLDEPPGVTERSESLSKDVDFNSAGSATVHLTAKPPKISTHPSSQESILPGNSVAFTIQATGTEPLTYQWQWSPPAGDEGGSEEWLNLNCNKVGLKVTGVQANNAGYYRCVVSNSAGSDTSQCALLTVAPELSQVLARMEMRCLASELAQKHVHLTELPNDESLEQVVNIEATDSRTKEELVQEKNILIIDLQSKQKLLQLQSEVMAEDLVYSAMLKEENTKNKRKIETLEEELHNVKSEFQSVQQETRIQEENLQAELKKKEETCWNSESSPPEHGSQGRFNGLKTQTS